MKSWDYEAAVFDGKVYCKGCLPSGVKPDDYSRVTPIFAEDKRDSFPMCEKCGTQHKYMNLTKDGRKYESQRNKRRQRLLGHRKPRLTR